MEAFSAKLAIDGYVTELLERKAGLKKDRDFVILSLRPGTGLKKILKAVEKVGGFYGITKFNTDEIRYFIFFKNMKKEAVANAIDDISLFGKCDPEDKSHFVEFELDNFPGRKFYAVRIDFEIY